MWEVAIFQFFIFLPRPPPSLPPSLPFLSSGEAQGHRRSDGPENEQEPQNKQDYAERDPASQQTLPSQHTQVSSFTTQEYTSLGYETYY